MTSRRLLDPATKLLLNAADYIETHGWCQYNTKMRDGRVCLIGAMWEADSDRTSDVYNIGRASDEYKKAHTKLSNYILSITRKIPPSPHIMRINPNFSITEWNDTKERSKDEVVTILRGAALS